MLTLRFLDPRDHAFLVRAFADLHDRTIDVYPPGYTGPVPADSDDYTYSYKLNAVGRAGLFVAKLEWRSASPREGDYQLVPWAEIGEVVVW